MRDELAHDQIKHFFGKSNMFSWINLSGGEIFLRKDLLHIIETIVANCKHLYLLDFPTNGQDTERIVSLTKNILKFRLPKVLITISMDGPAEVHDQIRGATGAWVRAVKTFAELKKFRNRKFDVFFGMTLQQSNLGRFQETVEAVNKNIGGVGHNDFHINIIQGSDHYYGNAADLKDKDTAAFWKNMNEIIRLRKYSQFNPIGFLESRYQELSRHYLKNNITPIPCQALSASFFMDPYGNVYPCSVYDKPVGNIRDFDYDIHRLWRSALRKETRILIKNRACPNCWTPCEAYQSILANIIPKIKINNFSNAKNIL
jgi:radical SAM protein with 4Fe4S-binding SPASM domain